MKAYSAVAFFLNEHYTALKMAKTRVAPVIELTLPQLELIAVLIGARLVHHLPNALDCKEITLQDRVTLAQNIKTAKTLHFKSN